MVSYFLYRLYRKYFFLAQMKFYTSTCKNLCGGKNLVKRGVSLNLNNLWTGYLWLDHLSALTEKCLFIFFFLSRINVFSQVVNFFSRAIFEITLNFPEICFSPLKPSQRYYRLSNYCGKNSNKNSAYLKIKMVKFIEKLNYFKCNIFLSLNVLHTFF